MVNKCYVGGVRMSVERRSLCGVWCKSGETESSKCVIDRWEGNDAGVWSEWDGRNMECLQV